MRCGPGATLPSPPARPGPRDGADGCAANPSTARAGAPASTRRCTPRASATRHARRRWPPGRHVRPPGSRARERHAARSPGQALQRRPLPSHQRQSISPRRRRSRRRPRRSPPAASRTAGGGGTAPCPIDAGRRRPGGGRRTPTQARRRGAATRAAPRGPARPQLQPTRRARLRPPRGRTGRRPRPARPRPGPVAAPSHSRWPTPRRRPAALRPTRSAPRSPPGIDSRRPRQR